ncbi:hypothetical protein RvY_01890 [Ramazzottius varieornatus]|uniref:C2H2-type domain-containing protein n=1 Tax=Ramazzottius varieornatus TaxID=947166 RepID=A0A1D1UIR2_RAMVA|nr:hypothetical protein RvY_01890 [Ramazzottius varieornatus]
MDDTLRGRLGESIAQYDAHELIEKYRLVKVSDCTFARPHATATGFTAVCSFSCTDKARMDEHRKLVHGGDKPFVCGIDACFHRCKGTGSLKIHVKSCHPNASNCAVFRRHTGRNYHAKTQFFP